VTQHPNNLTRANKYSPLARSVISHTKRPDQAGTQLPCILSPEISAIVFTALEAHQTKAVYRPVQLKGLCTSRCEAPDARMQFSRHLTYIHCTDLGQSAIQFQTKTTFNTFSNNYLVWAAAASINSTLIPQLEYHPRADSASNADELQRMGNAWQSTRMFGQPLEVLAGQKTRTGSTCRQQGMACNSRKSCGVLALFYAQPLT